LLFLNLYRNPNLDLALLEMDSKLETCNRRNMEFTKEQTLLRETVARFAREQVAPLAAEIDQKERFPFAPILKTILDKYEQGSYDISSLRYVAGLDSVENIQRFLKVAPHVRYWTGFGQTEVMGVSGCHFDEKPGSAGRSSPFARVSLFDQFDREVPPGFPGEICVRSPAVFLGYWRREEDNAYTFRNGWHHTGDIGRFDEEGFLWYVKRKAQKELIKPGGENVYPFEVEKVILQHESVLEVSVIGVPDPQWIITRCFVWAKKWALI
jgi:long-chain acyl-CoA synthetase